MRFFGIIGLFGLIVFMILLIVSFFKKSSKQRWVIGILSSFLCISISIIISMSSDLTQKADINLKATEIMNDASEDITTNIDSTLLDCAKNTFAKIGIKEELSFEVIRDDESSGIRDVSLLTEYESIKMKFSCMSVDEWYPVSIQDADSDNYYWLDDDVKDYGDVYNWKTGEIISKQASPLPDPVENFKEGSEEIMEELDKELEELRESFKNLEIRK